jgi:hypothetical protein
MLLIVLVLFAQLSPTAKPATVQTLAVQITTRDVRGAGTDNAVYFDVGPWAWRLNKSWRNDFERGHTDTFNLEVPAGFDLNDIVWLRLHKKGLFGVTGTRDGFAGAWHPEQIALLVNGVEYARAEIKQPLNSRYWFWTALQSIDSYADPHSFARSLRLKPNERLPWLAKATGFFTTPFFKKRGISGWIKCPEQRERGGDKSCSRVPPIACATGRVFRTPAISNDGLATIDLALDALEFCSASLSCRQRADLVPEQTSTRRRYVRVEHRHRGKGIPKKGELVYLCGKLLWDTDREGWWEIHPSDVPLRSIPSTRQQPTTQLRR